MDTILEIEEQAYKDDCELGLKNPGLKCEEAYLCWVCRDWHQESDDSYGSHIAYEDTPTLRAVAKFMANMEVVA